MDSAGSDSEDFIEDDSEISDDEENFEFLLEDDTNIEEVAASEQELDFPLRISCVIHGIQLILCFSVEKKCARLWKLIAHLRRMVKYIRKSPKAKERFYQLTQSTLLLPCKTRWNGNGIMVIRYIKFHKQADQVLKEVPPKTRIPAFSIAEITVLTEFGSLISKFQKAIMDFQQHTITSSAVYGTLKDLIEETSKTFSNATLTNLATVMKNEIIRRFGKFIYITHEDFDPHFVLCALLDPKEAICLFDIPVPSLANFLKQRLPSVNDGTNNNEPVAATSTLSYRERIALTIQRQRENPQNDVDARITSFVKEMVEGRYIDRNSIDFWKNIPSDTVSGYIFKMSSCINLAIISEVPSRSCFYYLSYSCIIISM